MLIYHKKAKYIPKESKTKCHNMIHWSWTPIFHNIIVDANTPMFHAKKLIKHPNCQFNRNLLNITHQLRGKFNQVLLSEEAEDKKA